LRHRILLLTIRPSHLLTRIHYLFSMAPVDMQTYFGANPTPKVVALTGLVSIALCLDLPELCLLGGLVVYAAASTKNNSMIKMGQDLKAFSNRRIVERLYANYLAILFVAMFMASIFGVMIQFAIALMSAFAYLALYEMGKRQQDKALKVKQVESNINHPKLAPWRRRGHEASDKVITIQQSKAPVARAEPVVVRNGLEADVHDIVQGGLPTSKDDAIVRQLVKMARKCILPVIPEAEISAIPACSLEFVGASGAKPEVEMVITVDKDVLAQRLKTYFLRGQTRIQKSLDTLSPESLQKTATKVLSERLTFVRFWRSQFSGPEPMIVLLIPVELGFFNYPIRLNFSVNTPYPLRLSTLLSKENARSKELISIVTRWARERCIANTSRGQPHAYAWGLMVIYFLRCGPLNGDIGEKGTVELLKEFVQFYSEWFNNCDKPVAICFTKKDIQQTAESQLWGIPHIEDPFDNSKDAGACMTADGVVRVKDELIRAQQMFFRDQEVKLAELLERWMPPGQEAQRA